MLDFFDKLKASDKLGSFILLKTEIISIFYNIFYNIVSYIAYVIIYQNMV